MIQKGDELINGVNNNYQYPYTNYNSQLTNSLEFEGNSGHLIQAMSFEEYVPQESTLPSVETVLPQYIPTPPPSLPSPSVNIATVNTTISQFQHQHQTPAPPPLQLQHNQNITNHYYYKQQQQLQHHQQVGFHSSLLVNHTNNKNIESTRDCQLLVEYNFFCFDLTFLIFCCCGVFELYLKGVNLKEAIEENLDLLKICNK